MYIVQSVLNRVNKINPKIKTYVLSLMLAQGKKNCAAMARDLDISPKQLYSFLANATDFVAEIENYLIEIAKKTRIKNVRRTLVIDPSQLIKTYSQKMEKVCYDRSGCTKNIERGLVPIYATIVDENVTIPLKLEFWVQKKITGKKRYKSKIDITIDLINYLIQKGVEFDYISLDGAYAIEPMFSFFRKNKSLQFTMRIPSNRSIQTDDGVKAQLKNHPALKLKRNEREKTIKAKCKGGTYFFTIQKRKTPKGEWERVFIVSNIDTTAKKQVASYDLRWPIEKANRTNKQKFGAGQNQTVSSEKQRAHIMAGFLAYAILSSIINDKKSQSVDSLINEIRDLHFNELIGEIRKQDAWKSTPKGDPVEQSIQIWFQNYSQTCDAFMDMRC